MKTRSGKKPSERIRLEDEKLNKEGGGSRPIWRVSTSRKASELQQLPAAPPLHKIIGEGAPTVTQTAPSAPIKPGQAQAQVAHGSRKNSFALKISDAYKQIGVGNPTKEYNIRLNNHMSGNNNIYARNAPAPNAPGQNAAHKALGISKQPINKLGMRIDIPSGPIPGGAKALDTARSGKSAKSAATGVGAKTPTAAQAAAVAARQEAAWEAAVNGGKSVLKKEPEMSDEDKAKAASAAAANEEFASLFRKSIFQAKDQTKIKAVTIDELS